MRRLLVVFMLGLSLAIAVDALSVKVTETNQGARRVTVLLPAHNTLIKGIVNDDRVRVVVGEWYNAHLEQEGESDPKNILVIKVPGEKPQRIEVLRVQFQE